MAFTKETRKKILDKSTGKCEKCGKQLVFNNHNKGERGAWESHHKTSVKSGGKDLPRNGKGLS